MFSTSGGYHYACGGYHEYIGGCSVDRGYHEYIGDIMSTSGDVQYIGEYHDACGEQVGKNLSISIENPNVLNMPQSTEHPPIYS